jgi:hypothetical protein
MERSFELEIWNGKILLAPHAKKKNWKIPYFTVYFFCCDNGTACLRTLYELKQ